MHTVLFFPKRGKSDPRLDFPVHSQTNHMVSCARPPPHTRTPGFPQVTVFMVLLEETDTHPRESRTKRAPEITLPPSCYCLSLLLFNHFTVKENPYPYKHIFCIIYQTIFCIICILYYMYMYFCTYFVLSIHEYLIEIFSVQVLFEIIKMVLRIWEIIRTPIFQIFIYMWLII